MKFIFIFFLRLKECILKPAPLTAAFRPAGRIYHTIQLLEKSQRVSALQKNTAPQSGILSQKAYSISVHFPDFGAPSRKQISLAFFGVFSVVFLMFFCVCSYVFTVYDCSNCTHVGPCKGFALFSILLFFSTVFLDFIEQIR